MKYGEVIQRGLGAMRDMLKSGKAWNNDDNVIELLEVLAKAYGSEIHDELKDGRVGLNAEKEVRRHIRDIINVVLRPVYVKIAKLAEGKKQSTADGAKMLNRYMSVYDDFYALCAMRSLKHYALYMEMDKSIGDRVWQHAMPCFEGFFYWANKMVLDGSVKRITKQYPTGYGKSYSDSVLISWIFGNDINADCMKVVGNPTLVADTMVTVSNLMVQKRYAKVFPYYAKFNGSKDDMFTICKIQQGVLLINGSAKAKSLLATSKDTAIDGGRFKYRFYDDVTRSKDKDNAAEHDRDWAKYNDSWKKREYDQNNSFEIAGGTAYSIYDFLSRFKETYGKKEVEESKLHKFVKINKQTNTVFIACPLLDYETDESTYPLKYPTEEARAERNRDMRTFEAMCQQNPLPPDTTPFYWDNLTLYGDDLPEKESTGGTRKNYCRATLDLPRTGKNNASLAIISEGAKFHYLIDCFYDKKPLDYVYDDGKTVIEAICDKIIQHNVNECAVETNVVANIKSQMTDILKKKGYKSCKFIEIYSTEKKENKIFEEQSTIINCISFPKRDLYAESSHVGRFMRDFVCWNPKAKDDDSPDTLAMHARTFIKKKNSMYSTFSTFSR